MHSFSPRPRTHGIDPSRPPSERYRILGRIAAGGMAEIYLGRMATRSGGWREVVLKRLMPDLQSDKEFVQMFYDEARIASRMNHPNIVQIYELGELDSSLFIAMELIRGVNLKELYERSHAEGKPMSAALVLKIGCGALEALSYAHSFVDEEGVRQNVVHRDVSPQNILVTYQGEVKLVDFGVAKAENRVHQTRQGLIKGKFAYMAPEQVTGEKVDGRSDLFALAEVLYLLLLHRHPFYAESDAAVLQAVIESRATSPTSLDPKFSPALAAILMRALQRKPDGRYADADAMRSALETYMSDRSRLPTAETLGRFVRDLFADRLQLEEQARKEDNDDLLVEAMRVGKKARALVREASKKPKVKPAPAQAQAQAPASKKMPSPATEDRPITKEDVKEVFDLYEPSDPDMETVSVGRTSHAELSDDLQVGRVYAEPEIDRAVRTAPKLDERDGRTQEETVLHVEESTAPPPIKAAMIEARPASAMARGAGPRKRSRVEIPAPETDRIGRYTLIETRGFDSIAEVFVAKMTGANGVEKRVLLKRIIPELTQEPSFVETLTREVKLAARLTHPNIVQVLDFGLHEGSYFLVNEYVPGYDLSGIVAESLRRDMPMPIAIGVRLIADVVGALAAAHSEVDDRGVIRPVVHRDLTPERVLVTRHGAVKIADFGIATAASVSMMTSSEKMRGQPDYMAPEQLSREYGVPDARSDVYSAGMLLYELLTLENPFRRATTFETMMAVLRDPVRAIGALRADTPKALEMIVEVAVARAPGERHPTAAALARDLERFLVKANEIPLEHDVANYLRDLFLKLPEREDIHTDAGMDLGHDLVTGEAMTTAHAHPLVAVKPL